jgi:hypothetical protein
MNAHLCLISTVRCLRLTGSGLWVCIPRGKHKGGRPPCSFAATLFSRVQDTVSLPEFDPAHLRPGIVHLGCGNFHRAHQVAATQAAIGAMGREGLGWGIVSAAMRKPDLAQALGRQDNLYAPADTGPAQDGRAAVMASITDTVFARAKDAALAERIADPQNGVSSLWTVTASGYYLTAQGRLDSRARGHPFRPCGGPAAHGFGYSGARAGSRAQARRGAACDPVLR